MGSTAGEPHPVTPLPEHPAKPTAEQPCRNRSPLRAARGYAAGSAGAASVGAHLRAPIRCVRCERRFHSIGTAEQARHAARVHGWEVDGAHVLCPACATALAVL